MLRVASMEETICHSFALEAAVIGPHLGVKGQEEVISEVFIMTLARISWVWVVPADAREFWL